MYTHIDIHIHEVGPLAARLGLGLRPAKARKDNSDACVP